MASSSLEEIELGFAEKPDDPKRLTSPYFPSKIGGRPAWLVPNLPTPEDLFCKKCNKPRVFLLQVYAPIDHLTHCYHRTLYIFCCREPSCHSRNFTDPFLVLRCNLPQVNSFYDGQPTELVDEGTDKDVSDTDKHSTINSNSENDIVSTAHPSIQDNSVTGATTNISRCSNNAISHDNGDDHLVEDRQQTLESNCNLPPLCIVCGCSGPKRCAKCHSMSYCSREHQVIHWKAGHKKYCGDEKRSTTTVADGILFDEFEIVTEPETPIKIVPEKTEEERLKDYQNYLEQHSGKFDPAKMDKMCFDDVEKEVKKDKQFMTFKKRIKVEPDQVIRYQRGGAPLWISSENIPNQIPDCERCGSRRVFEFQVMPQLLYYLRLDSTEGPSIDWGTLVVYTCEKSCGDSGLTSTTYQPEFLCKQDLSMY